jgi:hypothetical protein
MGTSLSLSAMRLSSGSEPAFIVAGQMNSLIEVKTGFATATRGAGQCLQWVKGVGFGVSEPRPLYPR